METTSDMIIDVDERGPSLVGYQPELSEGLAQPHVLRRAADRRLQGQATVWHAQSD